MTSTDLRPSKLYENLADALTRVFDVKVQIRFHSYYFAAKVLFQLSALKEKGSDYTREHDVIELALQRKIETLDEIIKITKKRFDFIQFFESEWEFIKGLNWVEKNELPINYIMHSNDYIPEVPLQYRRSLNQDDVVKTEIRLFLLLRKLNHLMIKCEILETTEQVEYPLNNFFKSSLEEGKDYFLNISCLKGKKLIKIRSENMTKFIIDDLYFFILGCRSDSKKTLRIESNFRFSKIRQVKFVDLNTIQFIFENKHFSFQLEDKTIFTRFKSSFISKIEDCLKKDLELLRFFISKSR